MKKFIFYLILTFLWSNIGHTQKISFYDLKIGDKITDHFTYRQIDQNYTTGQPAPSGEYVYGKDKIYSYITIKYDKEIFLEDFSQSGIQIYYNNKTDKIVSIGKVEMSKSFQDCIIERDQEASFTKKSYFNLLRSKDTYQFPDGMVDIMFLLRVGINFSFRCYAYQILGYKTFSSIFT